MIYRSVVKQTTSIARRTLIILILGTVIATSTQAQYKNEKDASIPLEHFYIERQKGNALRYMLSKLHFGFSTGFGRTAFKHNLDGFGIRQGGGAPQIFAGNTLSPSYTNWINTIGVDSSGSVPTFAVSSDTAELGFRSTTISIPLKATIHLEFDRFRIGGGYSFDYTRIGKFKPTNYKDEINTFKLNQRGFFLKHYFGMLGASVYRYYEYLLVVDMNIGGYKLGRQFNMGVIQKGMYFNFGVTAEREMSEYFKLFVRPSYEIRSYKLGLPESGGALQHKMNTFYVNFGFTYRIPELPKCFHKQCHAQINHAHGDREYRSRRHPIYKKQNPHYGENYPTLIKYKGKNKRKLNPY